MTIEDLVTKYIRNVDQAFNRLDNCSVRLKEGKAKKVLDYARRYFEDAKYYRDQKGFETALVSIAYCEGLLDALKLLEVVSFQWSSKSR